MRTPPAPSTAAVPNWLDRRLRRLQGPDRPWTILLTAHLAGPLTRTDIENAWRAVAAARPELHVTSGSDDRRVPAPVEPGVVVGSVERELDRPRHRPDETAVGVVIDRDPTTSLSLVVDHSLTDGLGARAILEDLLDAIAGREVAGRTAVADESLDSLRSRRLGLRAALDQIPPRRVATLGELGTTTRCAERTVDLGPIHRRRRGADVSVGVVIIGSVLDVLRDHRGDERSRATIAVGVPADLRRHIGEPTGVGNAIVNLTVTGDQGRRAASAGRDIDLAAVADIIAQRTTRRRLGETLGWVKRATRPGPPRRAPRSGRHVATAMVSNLGALGSGPGWDLVDRVGFAPPAHQTMSIGLVGHRDQLTFTVRSRLADHRTTDRLADALAERLG